VVIAGYYFTGATSVKFNGVPATFVVNSSTQITATVPATATTGPVQVTAPTGTDTWYNNYAVLPTLTSFTPASGIPGSTVVITGSAFTSTTAVQFNSANAASFVVNSDTQITAVVPNLNAAVLGAGPITVTNAGGANSFATNFTVSHLVPTSLLPTRNNRSAATSTAVRVQFNEALTAGSPTNLRVFSSVQGGRKAGQYQVPGNGAILFIPTKPFVAGEKVTVNTASSIVGATSGATARQQWQFQVGPTSAGSRTFRNVLSHNAGSSAAYTDLAPMDLDGDGDLDLVATGSKNWHQPFSNNGCGSFVPGSQISAPGPSGASTASSPGAIEAGDLDNDGDIDYVTSDRTQEEFMSVFKNNGGTISRSAQYTSAYRGLSHIKLADFDSDGDLDVATLAKGDWILPSRGCYIGLNDGSGNFSFSHIDVSLTSYLEASDLELDVADMDSDGDLDLVIRLESTLRILKNDGVARFHGTDTSLPFAPSDVKLGDFDGDGDNDVLLLKQSTGELVVYRNAGDGTFSGTATSNVTSSAGNFNSAAVVDADGDGDLDVWLATSGLQLALNNGNGTFTSSTLLNTTSSPSQVRAMDMDADGDLDLLYIANQQVEVWYNQTPPVITAFTPTAGPAGTSVVITGTGLGCVTSVTFNGTAATFTVNSATQITATAPVGVTSGPIRVVSADGSFTTSTYYGAPFTLTSLSPARNFRKAARTTSVGMTFSEIMSDAAAGNVRVFANMRGGRKSGTTLSSGSNTISFDPADDFKPNELVQVTVPASVTSIYGMPASPFVYQFTAAATGGAGTFSGSANPSTSARPRSLTSADIDNDGDLDLLVAAYGVSGGGNQVSVRLNTNGTFGGTTNVTVGNSPIAVVAVDVDSDSDLDLLTANYSSNSVSVCLNNGNGAFGAATNFGVGNLPTDLVVADVDADGNLDVVTCNERSGGGLGTVNVRFNNGSGTFSSSTSSVPVGTNPTSIAAADVDGDGDLDLLVANGSDDNVSLLLNDGSGVFTATSVITAGNNPTGLTLGDIDGDGDLDLLTANKNDASVSVRLNTNGTFSGTTDVSVDTSPQDLQLGDIDGDGDLDLLATSNTATGLVSIRVNNGAGVFSGTTSTTVNGNPMGLVLADFDGDDDLDFATANYSNTGTASVRFNQNDVPFIASFTPTSGLPGTVVTITGDSFIGVTGVQFNGTSATSYTVNSSTQITATVPVGATTGAISITATAGTGTSSSNFTVLQVYNATLNQCLTTTSINSTGSGQWQYLLASNGQVVASINDQGVVLGTVSAQFMQASLAAVRADARGRKYLDRNWKLTAQNGFTGRSVLVRFYALNSEFTRLSAAATGSSAVSSLSGLRITQYSGNNEDCSRDNNTATTDERLLTPSSASTLTGATWFTVQATVADHFSEFYLHGGTAPLPVELAAFTAERAGTGTLLQWATGSEKNNDRFEVEASADGQVFRFIGQVAGSGTSTQARSYTFTDANIARYATPTVYYRLRQIDADGTFSYSPVRTVALAAASATLVAAVHPNPFADQLTVRLTAPEAGPVRLTLRDATGRVVVDHVVAAQVGEQEMNLPSLVLPTGMYLLHLEQGNNRTALKLTRE